MLITLSPCCKEPFNPVRLVVRCNPSHCQIGSILLCCFDQQTVTIRWKKIAQFLLLLFLEIFILCYIKVHFRCLSLILFFHPMTAGIKMTEHVSMFSFKTSGSALANSVCLAKLWFCFNVTPMLACKTSLKKNKQTKASGDCRGGTRQKVKETFGWSLNQQPQTGLKTRC